MKTWLKYGLIGGIILAIFAIPSMFILGPFAFAIAFIVKIVLASLHLEAFDILGLILSYFIVGFLLGALIGLIVQKVKK